MITLPANLSQWELFDLTLLKRRRIIARRSGNTLIFAEQEDRSWLVVKMRGGQILGQREFGSMPRRLHVALNAKGASA